MAKKNKDKFIETAQKFIQKQQFDKAIKEYEKAFEEDRKDARVSLKLGELYVKIKKPKDSIKYFRQAASNYAKDGFYPKAVAVYKQVLDIDNTQFDVRLEIADLHTKLGLMSDAVTQYRLALDKFEKENNPEKILEIARKMVEIEPQSAPNRIKLAECYFKSGKRDQGYVEFKKAADDLKESQRWDDLIKLYERLTKADPSNPENYLGFGDALLERGELERSFQAYHQVLKYRPDDTAAMEKVVTVSIRLKDTQNAVAFLKKLAYMAGSKGNAEAERTYLQRIYKLQPDPDIKAKLGGQTASPPAPPNPAAAKAPDIHIIPDEAEDDKIEPLMEADPDGTLTEASRAPLEETLPMGVSEVLIPSEDDMKPPTLDQVPGMLTEADVYLKYSLIDKAQQYVQRILSAFPDHHEALRIAALVDKENGKMAQAVQGLLKACRSARKQNALDEARMYAEEILAIEPSNTQAQALVAELDSGVEISIGIDDDEVPAPSQHAAAEETDMLVIEGEHQDEDLVIAPEPKAPIRKPARKPVVEESEPFGFVEEAGEDQLVLADDELEIKTPPPPPSKKPAPAEPSFELEGEAASLEIEAEPSAAVESIEPILEMESVEPVMEISEPPVEELAIEDEEEISIGAESAPAPAAAPAPPPRPPLPRPPLSKARIEADLEEAEFYVTQGLSKEAEKIYQKILDAVPDHVIARKKLDALLKGEVTIPSEAPIFEEIEEIEEVELEEEIPSLSSAVDGAEEALGQAFELKEKDAGPPLEALEEVALESQPPAPPIAAEPLEEADQPISAEAIEEEEVTLQEMELEEEIPAEAMEEVALESQPPDEALEPEALEEAEFGEVQAADEIEEESIEEEPVALEAVDETEPEDEEVQLEAEAELETEEEAEPAESIEAEPEQEESVSLEADADMQVDEEEEIPEEPSLPARNLSPGELENDAVEESPASDAHLNLEDEWGEDEAVSEKEIEAPRPESSAIGMDAVADAADEAWGSALEPEHEEEAPKPTTAEIHPEIEGVADAADEAFGAAFGDEEAEAPAQVAEEGFDLSSALGDDIEESLGDALQAEEASHADDIGSILESFRERVHDQIGQDATAHFDLGIAYKEMGLVDEAIHSFRTALKAGANPAECLHMIGLCFIDQKELSKAESVLREGLKEKNMRDHEVVTLSYELGVVLEEQGRLTEALETFKKVAERSTGFRDVENIIIRLEERLGGRPEPEDEAPSKATKRDKISYI